jgi:hypothetical protein
VHRWAVKMFRSRSRKQDVGCAQELAHGRDLHQGQRRLEISVPGGRPPR